MFNSTYYFGVMHFRLTSASTEQMDSGTNTSECSKSKAFAESSSLSDNLDTATLLPRPQRLSTHTPPESTMHLTHKAAPAAHAKLVLLDPLDHLALMDPMDTTDCLAEMVTMARTLLRMLSPTLKTSALIVPQDLLEHLVTLDPRDLTETPDRMVHLEPTDTQAAPDKLDPKDHLEMMVNQDNPESEELLASLKKCLSLLVPLDLPDLLAHPDPTEPLDLPVTLDKMDPRDHPETLAVMGSLVRKVPMETLERTELQDLEAAVTTAHLLALLLAIKRVFISQKCDCPSSIR